MGLFSRTLSRLEELKKVLTRDPSSRQFLALADEYRRQGQVREAISVLEQGLSQNPSAVAGHVALGRLLQQTGQVDSAIASFQAALRLDPQNLVALRQAADLYLSKGDQVEAIKKLKLFRGLSPGDREVNELIRQLDGELAALAAPRPPGRLPSGAFQAPPAQVPAFAFPAATRPEPPVVAFPEAGPPVPTEAVPATPEDLAVDAAGREAAGGAPAPPEVEEAGPTGTGELPAVIGGAAVEPFLVAGLEPPQTSPAGLSAVGVPEDAGAGSRPDLLSSESLREQSFASPTAAPLVPGPALPDRVSEGAPRATETLATLLRAQGHLGDAEAAYRELSSSAADGEEARRLAALADEIAATRTGTVRGRLEAWVAPFSRMLDRSDADLVGAVEEACERLSASSAVLTDFEGVPVVSVGPRSESEAMENLAAELTAFWKNARRSRDEIGEGSLDALVLTGAEATATVKVVTPGYALLLKTDPAIPAGRIRYEAARAAERLRPALL